jgi:hypothetical protein
LDAYPISTRACTASAFILSVIVHLQYLSVYIQQSLVM